MVLVSLLILIASAFLMSESDMGKLTVNIAKIMFAALAVIYFASLVNLLKPITIGVFLCLAIYDLICLYKIIKQKNVFFKEFNAGNSLFLFGISTIAFYIFYSLKQPLIYYWDEIKIWGPTAKFVCEFDRLYSIGVNVISCDRNYPAGNALLVYLVDFFSNDFKDWHILFAYAVLYFAVFAAASSLIYKKTGNKALEAGMFLVLFISPFFATYHTVTADLNSISYAYGTTMVDMNISVIFLAVVVIYLADSGKLWYILPLIYLVTVKKNGIFFALLAVCVIACFELFVKDDRKIGRKIIGIMLSVCAIGIAYCAWNMHLDYYYIPQSQSEYDLSYIHETSVNEEISNTSTSDEEIDPAFEAVKSSEVSIFSILIPSLRTARYNEILSEMKDYFLNNHETIFGRDVVLISLLSVLGICTVILSDKKNRIALLFITIGLTAGCFVYNLVISYQMQFYNDLMVEYPRYMVSYYYSWMFTVFVFRMLLIEKYIDLKNVAICALAVFAIKYSAISHTELTVFDNAENTYDYQISYRDDFSKLEKYIESGDRVYFVNKYLDTDSWHTFRYYMLPAICGTDINNTGIDFSIGFCSEENYNIDKEYMYWADENTYLSIMKDYFDYIYIYEPEDEYVNSYSDLFSDGIKSGGLYEITDDSVPMRRVN